MSEKILNKKNLIKCFEEAEKEDKYIYVLLSDGKTEELIINKPNGIKEKIEYYNISYDENLKHWLNPEKKIIDYGCKCRDCLYVLVKNYE